MHLLIVEDEAAHVEAIRRAFDLTATRPDLHVVGTLREYRERIAVQPPDLALVDLNLPDGRATEILTHPAAAAPFPILVMTAFGSQQIVVEVMKGGALDYV
ncbi:MAG: response regulator, partial [Verrucomicrobiota bacterium]